MKTLQQFAKWLDKQHAYLGQLAPEAIEENVDTCREVQREAARYAAYFGCDSFSNSKTTIRVAQTVLGKYRAWVSPQLVKDGLTAQEAAEKMGVTLRTIRAMIADGRLPHRKFGRQVRIRAEDCVFKEQTKKTYRHLSR